ncbi:ADP compounds hydrolase NudE [Candidatus Thioglobus sp.]|jgi:ADP-ribose diphosphatase|uniref:ADP compounds hydrolase NudE n=1 Tax=Candidatus Thioglobus sp. TaxID=2026721 RepID=UPI0010021931|nr:ADP compounds hydrolase NudE [Candidatus Thioglobus sp.]RUM76737.1 MAG: ADP compounds hydrolase NudE [Candidatus Thioglobus sp.]RUM80752.1 MAG: ADP compounds hydrolase NudE [Candidatus Thioglobus sp.]HIF47729.1 ADP compounds hydrolase NudE [Candidatus Thioglobus sp.]
MRKKPKILNIETLATTRVFNIERLDLEFSNGEKRQYERLKPPGNGAVLVIPMLDDDTVVMIYEYSGGTDRYELALTKGKIDAGETPLEAANRELIEEIGYGSNKLTFLKTMTLAPGYQSNITHIILAQDLYEASAEGDEPEPLEMVEHKLSNLEDLVYFDDLTEARSIAALYMAKEIIRKQNA